MPALGHNWVKDKSKSTRIYDIYKCDRKDCGTTKLVGVTANKFGVVVDGGKAYIGGSVVSKAESGKTVTITANAPLTGKKFDKWTVISGGVTLADANSETTTFKMPEGDVSVKATYKELSAAAGVGEATQYAVSFNTNGGSLLTRQYIPKNGTVKEPKAPTKDGFEFAGWYADKAFKVKYDFSLRASLSMPHGRRSTTQQTK